jgi:hypothetical protein
LKKQAIRRISRFDFAQGIGSALTHPCYRCDRW